MSHPDIKKLNGGVCTPQGFLASTASCGIKATAGDRQDLALIFSEHPCVSAGTFTTNRVKAAPVKVTQAHLRAENLRAIVANSGNANACTGIVGIQDARLTAKTVAKSLGLKQREIGICSTGVIGLPLPMDRLTPHLPELAKSLSAKNSLPVAQAIMTSDTQTKQLAIEIEIDGTPIRLGACCKGAGMISPSMATMLCFITTDAHLTQDCLKKATLESVENSFNRITIDGDMSTNDTVLILANGQAGNKKLTRNSKNCRLFRQALEFLMLEMAQAIVRDGERVTKFVTVQVTGAPTYLDGKKVAEAVANSALVKASWNGHDPNWGRIIHAVGYSGARIREELIDISYNGLHACLGGLHATKTDHEKLRKIAAKKEFTITIDLHLGNSDYTLYSSDLSPEYIDFNRSEYAYWKQGRSEK